MVFIGLGRSGRVSFRKETKPGFQQLLFQLGVSVHRRVGAQRPPGRTISQQSPQSCTTKVGIQKSLPKLQ